MADTNRTNGQARTRGAHHVGLTVPDLDRASAFFQDTLGFTPVGGVPEYPAVFLSDGRILITLWQARTQHAVPFDRHSVIGLHHLALAVEDGAALHTLHERVAAHEECTVEFPPEPLGGGPARHMMCYIPGGIRLELVAPEG